VHRILLIFSKTGNIRFIGHLDLLKTFQRAIKRANLPAAYSEGFNPHQKLGFALPLALGMEGRNEAAELDLAEPMAAVDVAAKLNAALPKGLLIHNARVMGADEKSPAALVTAACYEMTAAGAADLNQKANGLLARESAIVQKKTKSGVKDADIRSDIFSLRVSDGVLTAVLSAGGQRGLKPELLAGALNAAFSRYARIDIYKTIDGAFQPLISV